LREGLDFPAPAVSILSHVILDCGTGTLKV